MSYSKQTGGYLNLSRYPATLLRVVDGFHDGVYHKALVVGSIGGAAGGKCQDMAATGNIHAGIIQRKFFQIPQKGIVIFALTVIQRIARVVRFGIVYREDAAQVVAIRRVQGKRWVCAVKILLAVSIQDFYRVNVGFAL